MTLWKKLKDTIDEYIADETMAAIWPQIIEKDENHLMGQFCDHQAHTADEIRKNVNQISIECLSDLKRIANQIENDYYGKDDSDFYNDYPNLAKKLGNKNGCDVYALVDFMYKRIRYATEEPIEVFSFLVDIDFALERKVFKF